MTGWASKPAAAAVFASLLVFPTAFSFGQDAPAPGAAGVGPPVVLTPPGGGDSDGAAGTAPLPVPEAERAPSGIEVDSLAAVSTDYGGTLDSSTGGLPIDMWRGSDRAFIERLLPVLPLATGAPNMRALTRRLLLSSAEAPAGPASVNLMVVRAERLMAMGDREAASELLGLVSDSQRDVAAARLGLEAAWLAGEDERGCADVANLIRRFDQDPYLQKALIFCQARVGQTDEATLGLDLMREQGHTDDASFFELVGVLTGLRKSADVATLDEPKGLHFALLKATGQVLPDDPARAADPDVLAMRLAGGDGPARLAATEQAVAVGLATPEALARLYLAEPTTPEELAGAVDLAPESAHERAVLFQAASQEGAATTRAGLIQRALAAALRDGSFFAVARTYLPLLTQLMPEPAVAAIAGEAGRALYFGGRYEQAGAWLDVARSEAARNPDAAAAVPVLWLLARIAGGADTLVWDAKSVAAWRRSQADAGDADADLRSARLFAIFDGLGEPVGAAWQVLADPGVPATQPLGNPAMLFALDQAAAAGRLGETVMLALFALGADGPGGAHPIALARALAALRQVGLDAEARARAVEAAHAHGR